MKFPPLWVLVTVYSFLNVYVWTAERLADGPARVVRVALGGFTSDSSTDRDLKGCQQYADALPPWLTNTDGVQWIERARIDDAVKEMALAVSGLAATEQQIRLGRLVGADWMVSGRFSTQGETRALRLEVVELVHADLLAYRQINLLGDIRFPLSARSVDVSNTVNAIGDALQEARTRAKRFDGRKTVAPLFFRNTGLSPRLDYFEAELVGALRAEAEKSDDLRLLEFSRVVESMGERQLALAGLTTGKSNAWNSIADAYLWGTFEELPAPGLPFAQVPVDIFISIWAGETEPMVYSNRCAVADLTKTAGELASRVLEQCHHGGAFDPAIRRKIAQLALNDALARKKAHPSKPVSRRGIAGNEEDRRIRTGIAWSLNLACFFAPENRQAQWERIEFDWPSLSDATDDFAAHARRISELRDFVMNLEDPNTFETRRKLVESMVYLLAATRSTYQKDWDAPHEAIRQTMVRHFIEAVDEACRRFQKDLSPREAGEWLETVLKEVDDPKIVEPIFDVLWPRYQALFETQLGSSGLGDRPRRFLELRQRFFLRLNKPERAAQWLAPKPETSDSLADIPVHPESPGVPVPPGSSRKSSETNTPARFKAAGTDGVAPRQTPPFSIDALNAIDRLQPAMRELPIPKFSEFKPSSVATTKTARVRTMAWMADALWISASEVRGKTCLLARYCPASHVVENISDKLGSHSPVSSLLEAGDSIWMTLDGDGVWSLNPTSLVLVKYGPRDGVLSAHMLASARWGERMLLAGEHAGQALINLAGWSDPVWERMNLNLDFKVNAKPRLFDESNPPLFLQTLVCGRWLLLGSESWRVLDTQTGQSTDLAALLEARLNSQAANITTGRSEPSPRGGISGRDDPSTVVWVQACAAETNGFWVASNRGLFLFDPQTQTVEKMSDMSGTAMSIANDKEHLWVACGAALRDNPARSSTATRMLRTTLLPRIFYTTTNLLLFEKSTRSWKGRVVTPNPITVISLAPQSIFLGMLGPHPQAVELPRASLPPRGDGKQQK